MQRAVTAIYPSYATATLVREELEQLGLGRHHVTILPDADVTSRSDRSSGDVEASFDQLHDLGLPDDDARTYQQALLNGDYVVSVSVDDGTDLSRVQEIMRRPEEAYDLDELDTRYSSAEFVPPRDNASLQMAADVGRRSQADLGSQQQGFASSGSMGQAGGMGTADGLGAAAGLGGAGYTGEAQYNEDGTVKVVEEELAVGKRAVERGAVRVRSYVREVPVEAEVDLRATRVFVERRPVDRPVTAGDINMGDQVLEARETAEEAVVAKEARVVEEIGLRQETQVEHQHIHDTVRKTEVEIEDTRTGTTQGLTGSGTTGTGGTSGSGSSGSY
jgi:uncharacterized protein (TIGR02271 family)